MTRSKAAPRKAPKRAGKQVRKGLRLTPLGRLEAIKKIYVRHGEPVVLDDTRIFVVLPVDVARRIYELAGGTT